MLDRLLYGKEEIFDLVGIGFGPSNLAVGAALLDRAPTLEQYTVRFLDRKPSFSWHQDMLLDDARMQVSFLKDLATMRDPSSRFTFLNYVFHAGRLSKFVNLKTFYPSRREFSEYLAWVAAELGELVQYNAHVTSIDPIVESGQVSALQVSYNDETGTGRTVGAKNIILSTGPIPWMPFSVPDAAKNRVFHSSEFLTRAARMSRTGASNVLIVGGSQSGVECALYLYSQAGASRITLCSRGHALRTRDDSCFVNEIFLPESIDLWQRLDRTERSNLLAEYRYSNYSAVEEGLLDRLYSILYEQSVCGAGKRMEVLTGTEVMALEHQGETIECLLGRRYDSGAAELRHFDYVVLATGYRSELDASLVRNLGGILLRDKDGEHICDRMYELATVPNVNPKIFAFGINEMTHGIGDTLLSNMAIRADEILALLEAGVKPNAFA
jgi:L-ornithine N5-oxygenase